MASNSFHIPGLSTLSQPQNAAPSDQDVTSHPPVTAGDQAMMADPTVSSNGLGNIVTQDASTFQSLEQHDTSSVDATAMEVDQPDTKQADAYVSEAVEEPPSPPSLTQGLEALLGGLDPVPDPVATTAEQEPLNEEQNTEMQDDAGDEGQDHPEWEEDSSPYESSSDSSSSDDSDDEEDSDDGKELLNPEEMARILMEAGSDDEGEGKGKGVASGGQLRTKNELPEEVIPKPDVTITAETKMEELGEVEHIVENNIVIKAFTSGEYRVLDSGSVLFNGSRTVVAALADLIGTVREPRYTAVFTNEEEIKSFNIALGTRIYYTPEHASFVFTEPLQGTKGTDASNWHDEEAGMDEVEFSDDEKEAAYKREQKEKRRGRHGGARGGSGTSGRGGRGGSYETPSMPTPVSLNYDDDDGPYRPLARPVNFGQGTPSTTVTNGSPNGLDNNVNGGGSYRGGRGDSRGRGRGRPYDRGSRGNRGSHRGGSGHSQPPRSQGYTPQPQQQQQYNSFPPPPPQFGNGYPVPPPPQFYGASGGQQPPMPNPQFPFPSWPQNVPANFVPPPPPQFQQQPQGGLPYNPAFYSPPQNQYQGHNNSGQQPGQWPHQSGSG
ncbi:Gar1/Naf1 RNA binding region-domain-containing protein [Xylariales sp. AK1849]|nr:Gar1/Naf1 RNA binding region-domain-containing protein [Xylariales sp. AK1849]